jgi:hypothetical protein
MFERSEVRTTVSSEVRHSVRSEVRTSCSSSWYGISSVLLADPLDARTVCRGLVVIAMMFEYARTGGQSNTWMIEQLASSL